MRGRSVALSVVIPAIAVVLLVNIALIVCVRQGHETALAAIGEKVAQAALAEVRAIRSFYTAEIVPRAEQAGMKLDHDFATAPNTLPLPACFVNAVGVELAETQPGLHIRLFSEHPFPSEKLRVLDSFEQAALAAIRTDGDHLSTIEDVGGRISVRYAVPDVMAANCVTCHNSHAESPKRDWKAGDVRGVLAVTVPVDDAAAVLAGNLRVLVGLLIVGSVVVTAGLWFTLRRRLSLRLGSIVHDLDLIEKDRALARRLPSSESDEIGSVGRSFNSLLSMLGGLVSRVVDSSGKLNDGAGNLASSSLSLAQGVTEQAASIDQVRASLSSIADNANANLEQVRSATQMGIENRRAADGGYQAIDSLTTAMAEVEQSSKQVSEVLSVIDQIAFQTNLLALNASVEAARAGEAGRGFAVVADEVRALAQRSAGAARDVAEQVAISNERAQRGARIVVDVRQALDGLLHGSTNIADALATISSRSSDQAVSIKGIGKGLAKIGNVTSTCASVGEELAAAAHEMKDQAMMLSDLMAVFHTGAEGAESNQSS